MFEMKVHVAWLLMFTLSSGTGFQVSSTHKPCTKGLWMWSSPVERKNADGSKYHLVSLLVPCVFQRFKQTAHVANSGSRRSSNWKQGLQNNDLAFEASFKL